MLRIETEGNPARFAPLDEVTVTGADEGTLMVRDGRDRQYLRADAADPFTFRASGALGTQTVLHLDADRTPAGSAAFALDCQTHLDDEGGRFGELLFMLYWTMVAWHGETSSFRDVDRVYKYFVGWLRDHVHTLKGMKYYYPDLKSGIELYADTQRDDGMVFDKVDKELSRRPTHRDHWFGPGGFIKKVDGGLRRMERIPVENDVEYLFVEGLYYTWKATGDTEWMAGLLDNAVRAFQYSTSDPYRWSEKYGLLKRGFTIDTWDFQAEQDAEITGFTMVVDPERTRFGVMHGDNTGFAAACRYLREMLEAAGRPGEAERWRRVGREVKQRLDELAWNGEFYTHHVPEDPHVERDLGVDQPRQVSLSNAYALNRGVTHEQAVAIIRTYQRIREEMPGSSPGEFYQIYPPFERGFGGHGSKWHYMNGGVTSIVAGELAHGAFEHGFECYGVDILERVAQWARSHDGYLHCTYRGKMPEPPERSFTSLDIRAQANIDLKCPSPGDVIGWAGEQPGNDLANLPTGEQQFEGIALRVIDPAENQRRAAIGISSREGFHETCEVPVGAKAASVYLLHTAGGENPIGRFEVHYADGTSEGQYVMKGRHLNGWWLPSDPPVSRRHEPLARLAWWGPNDVFPNVGCYVYGWDNPHPDREIARLVFRASENGAFWPVLGVTLCDAPVFFPPSDVSFGIPDNWGAAAVVYALLEGLAGVVDTGVAFDSAVIAPRWSAAEVDAAEVAVRYRACGGYAAYRYRALGDEVRVELAGSALNTEFRLLLPAGRRPGALAVDGEEVEAATERIESSEYVVVPLEGLAARTIEVTLA